MTNRINGDFNAETIEAFRSAYAAQMLEPEDQEIDARTGLPTNLVLNTSPWIQHTGLWKANDGTDKNFIPNQTLVPGADYEGELEGEGEDLSEGELEELLEEVLEEIEMEELLADLDGYTDDFDSDELDDVTDEDFDDLDDLVDEILSDYDDEIEGEDEELMSEDDIDALITELEAELDLEEDDA